MERVLKAKSFFATTLKKYNKFLSSVIGVETEIFKSQIPAACSPTWKAT
jgi:hypothetical protein